MTQNLPGNNEGVNHHNIHTKIIRSLSELQKYSDRWNILALQAPQQSPMNSWCWLSAYFEKRLDISESWFCVVAESKDTLLGVFPVIVTPAKILGSLAPILRTPGDEHTIATDMVVQSNFAKSVIPMLINAALAEEPSYQYLEFSLLEERSPTLHWFRKCTMKFRTIEDYTGTGAYIDTRASFSSFWADMSKNLRSNLNKAKNKLQKLSNVQIEFKVGDKADEHDLCLMADVENKSWKGRQNTSIAKSRSLLDFYATLCHRLSNAGWLEWHFLHAENITIAANLAIRFGDSIILWKLGYDDEFNKYSPGSYLLEQLIQRACNSEDINEINLMTDMPWYDIWKMKKRKYFRIRIYSERPVPYFFALFPMKIKCRLREYQLIRKIYLNIKTTIKINK